MDDTPAPPPQPLKLGKKSFERVNEPTTTPDPNNAYTILQENRAQDPSLELPGIEKEIRDFTFQKWRRRLVLVGSAGAINAVTVAVAVRFWSEPRLAIPVLSAGVMMGMTILLLAWVRR